MPKTSARHALACDPASRVSLRADNAAHLLCRLLQATAGPAGGHLPAKRRQRRDGFCAAANTRTAPTSPLPSRPWTSCHRRAVEAIAVVSSDSDFAPLARKIARSGLLSIGIGLSTATTGLRCAFDHFVELEPVASVVTVAPALEALPRAAAGADADGKAARNARGSD